MPSNNGYQLLTNRQSSSNSPQTSLRPRSLDEICSDGVTPSPSLKIMDKVVWLSDNGPEYGVVKWLGKLPDVSDDWIAGVDFVNPVGLGNGLYGDQQLFVAKPSHASLVPIVGLMKATDFQGNVSKNFDNLVIPPLKPKRTKKTSESSVSQSKFYVNTDKDIHKDVKYNFNSDYAKLECNNHKNDDKSPTISVIRISNDLADLKIPNKTSAEKLKDNLLTQQSEPSVSNKAKKSSSASSIEDLATSNCFSQMKNNSPSKTFQINKNNSPSYVKDNSPPSKDDELFEIGSVVQVTCSSAPYHGVIRWLGFLKNDQEFTIDSIRKSDKSFKNVVAGIELEEEISGLTNGTLNGRRYFECPMNKAYFISLSECSKDSRFASFSSTRQNENTDTLDVSKPDSSLFGSIDCPKVIGDVEPLTSNDLSRLCGKNRGIQGHHNSCYLDATLFAMFAFTPAFESLLNRPKRANDIPEYNEVQRILKEEIVNPLRSNLYVRADRVMHLRQILEKISSVRGLTSEEKDPEEFINLLLNEILKTDPFLKLSTGLESLFYQLFIEKDENLLVPNVQQLFDQSFLASNIKLRQVPSCLMIQMPRCGRDFKMYSKIIPSLYLDITNVLENSPRQCVICGELAAYECKECFEEFGSGLDSISFCHICLNKTHSHKKRLTHKTIKLNIPQEFAILQNHTNIPRVLMELFAVLCIETSHYVSFVKCGTEPDSPWCFFDSMADRKGEQNGYNIPEVVPFNDLKWWLSKEGYEHLISLKDEKLIPELPRRLLSDAYICFYSSEVVRYR